MPASDPLDILLRHDHWGTRQVLAACEPLSEAQFHQRFSMGPGSLHDTIVHIIGAMRAWTDVLHQRDLRPRPEQGPKQTIAQLRTLLDQTAAELSQVVRAHPLDQTVTRTREGKTYTFTRGMVATHVTTHAMHHRAQCLNMLRQLGVDPLPKSSVTEWSLAGDSA